MRNGTAWRVALVIAGAATVAVLLTCAFAASHGGARAGVAKVLKHRGGVPPVRPAAFGR